MPIEGVHTIPGRGTAVSGRVERGVVKVGQAVEIVGLDNDGAEVVVTGTQAFRKNIPMARASMNVGLLLRDLKRGDVRRGQVLNSIAGASFSYALVQAVAMSDWGSAAAGGTAALIAR